MELFVLTLFKHRRVEKEEKHATNEWKFECAGKIPKAMVGVLQTPQASPCENNGIIPMSPISFSCITRLARIDSSMIACHIGFRISRDSNPYLYTIVFKPN